MVKPDLPPSPLPHSPKGGIGKIQKWPILVPKLLKNDKIIGEKWQFRMICGGGKLFWENFEVFVSKNALERSIQRVPKFENSKLQIDQTLGHPF